MLFSLSKLPIHEPLQRIKFPLFSLVNCIAASKQFVTPSFFQLMNLIPYKTHKAFHKFFDFYIILSHDSTKYKSCFLEPTYPLQVQPLLLHHLHQVHLAPRQTLLNLVGYLLPLACLDRLMLALSTH